ncbi:MAG: hypothetical protein K6U74_16940 [Firmicutes bacterium]|nr:hypothetical protein [Bacillota bacterium]
MPVRPDTPESSGLPLYPKQYNKGRWRSSPGLPPQDFNRPQRNAPAQGLAGVNIPPVVTSTAASPDYNNSHIELKQLY